MSENHPKVEPKDKDEIIPEDKKLHDFDADLSPQNPQNEQAATAQGLHFERGSYRDEDGLMIRDQFGQPY